METISNPELRTERRRVGPSADSLVILALDLPVQTPARFRRRYFFCRGADLSTLPEVSPAAETPGVGRLTPWIPGAPLPDTAGKTHIYLYPTRTYSEGLGSGLFSELSPEDRRMIRLAKRQVGAVTVCKVPLRETFFFDAVGEFFVDEAERTRYREERAKDAPKADGCAWTEGGKLVCFNPEFVKRIPELFNASMTRPNRQDYMWLATKTFGFNLVIRLVFVLKGVASGHLSVIRAILSTSWYQIQDVVFTVFGQTYMKFLGKMTGMVRVYKAYVGDFIFVYIQLCGFEFLNRLVLGPLGENPLVYTPRGLGLIFLNILQGMVSGGPLIPAINQMRKAGVISHSTMMHLYQVSSLTMQFGLFASFGYQRFYTLLTGAVLGLSWSSYLIFSNFFPEPDYEPAADGVIARLDRIAVQAAR